MICLQVMLDVAGLYLTTEDLDACQHQLMTLLKNDKENDAATIVSTVDSRYLKIEGTR